MTDGTVPGSPPRPPTVRPAVPEEFARLRAIELEADRLYETVGIGPFPEDEAHDRLGVAAAVFAVGNPPVGFVSIELVDDDAHIDQLSVLPGHGRRGIDRDTANVRRQGPRGPRRYRGPRRRCR